MTFLEALQSHRGGLVRIKTQLYWYGGRGWDGVHDAWPERNEDYAYRKCLDGRVEYIDGFHRSGEKFAIGDHLIFLSEGPGNTARVLHGVLGFCLIPTHFLRPV